MYSSTIIIENIDKAREFVERVNKFPNIKITLKSGNYSIDGHSIIGVISLEINKPVELIAEGDITDSFTSIILPYSVQ